HRQLTCNRAGITITFCVPLPVSRPWSSADHEMVARMELSTYSDGFRAQLGERERVVAAVFTTYSFEPEFFEQEIIPLMLDQSLAFSSDQRIKSIQVRE